jgi:hypothetical protein
MTTYVAFSTAWPLRKSNAIALGKAKERLIYRLGYADFGAIGL